MTKVVLGEWADGGNVRFDVPRFVETRGLIQASSGSGKSVALRKVLEMTHGHVQQLIVDPEGEFASLRETCDLIIAAANDADVAAHPKTAKLLAIRLLETEASAVLDISELKVRERHQFVRLFFESLLDAPKALRHPVLVVLDEAHLFAPEKGQGESEALDAVIDMASLGRKRGLSLLAATQRIGKYHKSAAADLKNRLIGNTALDVDVKRAAFDLGMPPKEALAILRVLEPGNFYAFGPAFGQTEPRQLKVGMPLTSHPKVGHKQRTTPPLPSEAIKALLPKLADLPKEAEQELKTVEDLRRELANARRELTQAKRAQPPAPTPVVAPKDVASAAAVKELRGVVGRQKRAIEELMKYVVKISATGFAKGADVDPAELRKAIDSAVTQAMKLVAANDATREKTLAALQRDAGRLIAVAQKLLSDETVEIAVNVQHAEPFKVTATAPRAPAPVKERVAHAPAENGAGPVRSQQHILDRLGWLEDHGIYPAPRETLAAVAGVPHTSGGFKNNLGALRSAGLICYPQEGRVAFTDAGRALAQPSTDSRPLHEQWLALDTLVESQRALLRVLVERHSEPLTREALAEAVAVPETSGGFKNNLGRLRTIGAIDYPTPGTVALTKYVMPS